MDDIRRPQHPQRRDYALPSQGRPPHTPAHRPAAHPGHQPVSPHHQPAVPPPAHLSPTMPASAPAHPHGPYHHPHHAPQPVHSHPQMPAHHQPAYSPPSAQQTAQPLPHYGTPVNAKSKRKPKVKPTLIVGIVLAAAAIFGAGYLLKSSSASSAEKGIPASITRQVNYSLYFPSPMPHGYTYMKDTATFQIGEVFYKFSNGRKRVTVKEEPINGNKPDLNLLVGYTRLNTPVGQAAVGTSVGQPTAVVVTKTTVITMNTIGGVSQNDLKVAINNLKDIGQNPRH